MQRRQGLKRHSRLRATGSFSRQNSPLKPSKITGGYKVPSWFNAIKPGSHGNTPAQKRLWRVVSEHVRQRDWELAPHCRGCGQYLAHWNEGQAAHFKRFSLCHSWFKFEPKNCALTCAGCNMLDDGPVLYALGNYLIDLFGPDHLQWIETENAKYKSVKMQTWEIVKKVEELAPHLTYNH